MFQKFVITMKMVKSRHYVDIFIPSQNRCIEVKSTWTAKKKKDNIYLKKEAGEKLGYKYDLWIFDQKGNFYNELIKGRVRENLVS